MCKSLTVYVLQCTEAKVTHLRGGNQQIFVILRDCPTRFTLRYLLTFTLPTSYKKEIHLNLPQAKSLTVWPYIYKLCTKTVVLLRILYFYCVFQKLQPITGRVIPLLCSAVLYVLSDRSSTEANGGNILSSFWSHRSSHPQKVVMSCEIIGFYSSVILRSWHETLYPTPFLLRNPTTTPFLCF